MSLYISMYPGGGCSRDIELFRFCVFFFLKQVLSLTRSNFLTGAIIETRFQASLTEPSTHPPPGIVSKSSQIYSRTQPAMFQFFRFQKHHWLQLEYDSGIEILHASRDMITTVNAAVCMPGQNKWRLHNGSVYHLWEVTTAPWELWIDKWTTRS